jgi:hypothetical protein
VALPVLSMLASAALIALAAGCGGSGEGGAPKETPAGISLVAEPSVVSPGDELEVRVSNQTAVQVGYGRGYGIERLADGGWEPVQLPPQVVPMIGLVAEPGELGPPVTVRVPEELEPGSYRVTLAQPPKGAGSPAAEFEVR